MSTSWRIKFSFSIIALVLMIIGTYGVYECQVYPQKRVFNYNQFIHLKPSSGWYQIKDGSLDYSNPIPYTNNFFKSGYLLPLKSNVDVTDQSVRVLVFLSEYDLRNPPAAKSFPISGMINTASGDFTQKSNTLAIAYNKSLSDPPSIIIIDLNRTPNPVLAFLYLGVGALILLLSYCSPPQINLGIHFKKNKKDVIPVNPYAGSSDFGSYRNKTLADYEDPDDIIRVARNQNKEISSLAAVPGIFKGPAPIIIQGVRRSGQPQSVVMFYETDGQDLTMPDQLDDMADDEYDVLDNAQPQVTIDDIRTKRSAPNPIAPPFDPY